MKLCLDWVQLFTSYLLLCITQKNPYITSYYKITMKVKPMIKKSEFIHRILPYELCSNYYLLSHHVKFSLGMFFLVGFSITATCVSSIALRNHDNFVRCKFRLAVLVYIMYLLTNE